MKDRLKEPIRGDLVLSQISERQRLQVLDALNDLNKDVDAICSAAEDMSIRIIKLSPILLKQISSKDYLSAKVTAGQIHMLSRLVEQKIIICLEKWRAGLTIANSSLIESKKPDYRRSLKLKKR
jgi:hypothetical protein